ncbi:MAG: hypothetical protein WAL29_13555 [Bacteroidales bacterium]
MKRRICFLIIGLFIAGSISAQNTDVLNNNSIIKMVKAKLSDELIIEVIQSSEVQFDLSGSALKDLSDQSVSQRVIDVMKLVSSPPVVSVIVPPENKPRDVQIPGVTNTETDEVNQVEGALGYVSPIKELIVFNEREFEKLVTIISGWDKKTIELTEAANEINNQIIQTENELRKKKNADSKGFSEEILGLKKKLAEYRENHSKAKANLLSGGENITKELEKISDEIIRAFGNKYNDVSQEIKSFDSDPSINIPVVQVTISDLNIIPVTTDHISPASEMLVWHQNELKELSEIIKKWNVKVREKVKGDAELSKQLEPLTTKLKEYQSDTKKYKTEISSLKKQTAAVEKERKKLADQMKDDSRELSGYIKQTRADIQKILEQRFADIIENITYSFQEKINL